MSQRIGQQPVLQALGETLKAQKAEAEAVIQTQQQRDLDAEAALAHRVTWSEPQGWLGRAEKISATKTALTEASQAQIEAAEARLAASDAVLGPLSNLIDGLSDISLKLDLPDTDLSQHYGRLRSMMAGVLRLERALLAAGPSFAALVPTAQLATLKKEVQHATELAVFKLNKAREAAQAKLQAAEAPDKAPIEEVRQRRQDDLLSGKVDLEPRSAASRLLGMFRREPPPILDATVLSTGSFGSAAAAADSLAKLLGDPGIVPLARAALAQVKGPALKSLSDNLKSYAVLADYASHALDYREVPVGFGSPKCRRSHQARDYGARDLRDSAPRQAESRRALAQTLKAALKDETPGRALKDALITSFLREVGVDAQALGAKFTPSVVAVRKALDEEAFVPLRALNEGLSPHQYQGPALSQMRASVARMTLAVVEGKLDAWKNSSPASLKQLAQLSPEAQAIWLSEPALHSPGPQGSQLTTQEASGHELFWATKVGGPSHAFDTMNQCILSLLGNARTRAITLKDSAWHNYAARAYLRVLPRQDGPPMLYLEPLQTDFPYRDHKRDAAHSAELPQAMLKHAAAKAKAMGLGLTWARGYERAADAMGLRHYPQAHRFVLEPSAVVVEASDTLGRHDWVQDRQQVIDKVFSTVSAEALQRAPA